MLHVIFINTIAKPIWEKRWLWVLYLALWLPNWLPFPNQDLAYHTFVLAALALFVIPHGVADLYLPAWILNPPWERQLAYWGAIMGIIAILAVATLGLYWLSINFSIALFSAIIMWHWGSLDTLRVYPHRGPSWVVGSMGRGMLVLVAPLFFQPLETQELILSLTRSEESFILTTLYSFSKYILILAIFLEILAVILNKFVEARGLPPKISAHATESLFILLTFAYAQPLLGLTFYFLILHSFRHINRVPAYISETRGNFGESGGTFRNFSYYFQRTNLITFVIILLMGGWFAWNIYRGFDLFQATQASLQPLFLLLIPHTFVSLLADFNPKHYEP